MTEYFIKFVNWAKFKIRIHFKESKNIYFKERDIWWGSLGVNIGHEQDGKNTKFERPILVLKKFNKKLLWILPLTSQNKTGKYYYQFEYENKKYSIILSQIRTISSKRLLRKIRRISKEDFVQIREGVKDLLKDKNIS